MSRVSRSELVKWVYLEIDNEDVQEELTEAIASAYSSLSDEQTKDILEILNGSGTDRTRRAAVLAICNE